MKTGATEVYLPFEMGYLPDEIKAIAENELGETDEVRKECLIEMRKLMKEEPKLYCTDHELYLLSFLRARKFNVKRGYGVLQNYYHVKKTFPDVYGKPSFDMLVKSAADKLLNILPYRDRDGCVVMVIKFENWDMENMKFSMFVHCLTVSLLLCVEDPATQVCGIKIIVDVNTLGFNHIRHIHPKYLTLIARGLRNCLPVRFRAIHIINESSFFQYLWNIISVALSDKIRNRAHFHASSTDSLKKHFDSAILPKEFDGDLEYDNRFWVKKVESIPELYNERMSYGYRSRKTSHDEGSK